jgi:hypothetical protein
MILWRNGHGCHCYQRTRTQPLPDTQRTRRQRTNQANTKRLLIPFRLHRSTKQLADRGNERTMAPRQRLVQITDSQPRVPAIHRDGLRREDTSVMVGTLALQLKPPHNFSRGGSELLLIASARGCPAAGIKCPKSEQWKLSDDASPAGDALVRLACCCRVRPLAVRSLVCRPDGCATTHRRRALHSLEVGFPSNSVRTVPWIVPSTRRPVIS